MSGLRLRETFNRLVKNSFSNFFKKTTAALLIASSLALPAQAHHNDNGDLDVRNSGTAHSQQVQSIQDKFNQSVRDRRMVLVDRDWFQINRAISDFRTDEELRNRFLNEYVLQNGLIHLPNDFFKDMADSDIFSNPHTQVFTIFPPGGQPMRACTIFGGRGEMDGRTAVREFINPSAVVHGNDIAGARVQLAPDAQHYMKFVTYHEIGHCMDDFFLPKMSGAANSNDRLAYYHRAETFADVFSALMMARDEGVTDIAETIANIRLANAALSGPYQAAWSSPLSTGFAASYIYATHRPVRAAQAYIDQNGAQALQALSYKEIAELTRDIVSQNALNQLEAEALMYLFTAKFDLSVWEQVKDTVPYVAQHYPHAVRLKAEIEEALRAVLDLSHIPANQSALERITFTGTPYQRAQEAQASVDQDALRQRARQIADEMLANAGGQNATLEGLIDAFSADKDRWRGLLSTGTEAEKAEALENLKVAGYALWLAAEDVRARTPAPAPANSNAPAQPSLQADTSRTGTGGPAPA